MQHHTAHPNDLNSTHPSLPDPVHVSANGDRRTVFATLSGQESADRPVEARTAGEMDTECHAELNTLLLNVRAGCRHSFDVFYDKTRARLLRAVQSIIRNRDDAADVLQDVYTKVWGRSAQFQHEKGHALNWALAIAHHTAVSSLRRRSARPQAFGAGLATGLDGEELDPYAGLESPWLAPDELAIRAQACRAVRHAVHRLPNDHREALLLAFYEGLSYDEVATRMSRPLGTVKSWIRRSLAALRPVMGVHHDARLTAYGSMSGAARSRPHHGAQPARLMPAMA